MPTKTTPQEQPDERKPEWRAYRARALGPGYANNRLYSEGQELMITIDAGIKKPRWVELLDDGVPSSDPSLLNSNDFAKAALTGPTSGFAPAQSTSL